jgi:hypothetical protein
MRLVKFIILGLLALFILLTGMGLLMPSSVTVGRSVEINASIDSVRYYTNDITNWKYWISGADTAYFKQLTNSSTEKNSQFKLGTYTITVIENNPKYISTSWKGEQGREQISRLELSPNTSSDIIVNWSFQQQLHWYFWERLGAMLHDKVFGPTMEVSLNKLKQVCEKNN